MALWLLSTVAALRVMVPFGGQQFTPLYIALVARTSLYAKSTTARLAKRALRAAGLDWLLLSDESTPQKMIQEMAGAQLPDDYEQMSEEQRVRLRREALGFVFQSAHLFPILTALENVELPLRLARTEQQERRQRASKALALVGLAERARHRALELSGGEQQRVALARDPSWCWPMSRRARLIRRQAGRSSNCCAG